jgi:hypothetical protein
VRDEYAQFWALKWGDLLRVTKKHAGEEGVHKYHRWIEDSFRRNEPHDAFARQLLLGSGSTLANPPANFYRTVTTSEETVETVSQVFLGVRLQCAKCHNHPFDHWTQDNYYGMAAFFSQVGRKPSSVRNEDFIFHKRGLASFPNPQTSAAVRPVALGALPQPISTDEDPRLVLVDWMAAPSNPFFSRVLVNRYWKHFFQRGLIEPEDDIRDSNPPSNPELLAALEKHFIQSGFDLKDLVRVITRSSAYQLVSTPNKYNSGDRQNYSRYYPRRLSAEVLLDSIDQIADVEIK